MSIPQRYRSTSLEQALAHVAEEAGELVSALGKTLRWGLLSVNPELPPEEQEPNIAWVRREVRDVMRAWDALQPFIEEAIGDSDQPADGGWQPMETAPEDGSWLEVRQRELFRFKLYKPGAPERRRRRGRWQKLTNEYGRWQNCEKPVGEWRRPNQPKEPKP